MNLQNSHDEENLKNNENNEKNQESVENNQESMEDQENSSSPESLYNYAYNYNCYKNYNTYSHYSSLNTPSYSSCNTLWNTPSTGVFNQLSPPSEKHSSTMSLVSVSKNKEANNETPSPSGSKINPEIGYPQAYPMQGLNLNLAPIYYGYSCNNLSDYVNIRKFICRL